MTEKAEQRKGGIPESVTANSPALKGRGRRRETRLIPTSRENRAPRSVEVACLYTHRWELTGEIKHVYEFHHSLLGSPELATSLREVCTALGVPTSGVGTVHLLLQARTQTGPSIHLQCRTRRSVTVWGRPGSSDGLPGRRTSEPHTEQ